MKQLNAFLLALAVGGSFAQTAVASEVYTYTGGNFDNFQTVGAGVPQQFSTSTHITFQFTIDTAIAANTTIAAAANNTAIPTISSWSFDDGIGQTVTNLNDPVFQSFSVTTDSTGAISAWGIALLPTSAANNYVFGDLNSNWMGCIGNAGVVGNCTGSMHSQAQVGNANWSFGGSSALGSWSAAPAPAAVPLPASFGLFSVALAGLGWFGKRRNA